MNFSEPLLFAAIVAVDVEMRPNLWQSIDR